MLFKIFKLDDTSKSTAFRVSIYNFILTVFLTALLMCFFAVIKQNVDESDIHVSRLIWVEGILNFLFLPFDIGLILGVKRDNYKWIRIWIKAKVVQASYIFLLNLVMQIYITASLNAGDGVIVLVYTLIVGVLYLENVIFLNNYHRYRDNNVERNEEAQQVPDNLVLKF